jgi:hypothetical protein
METSISISHLRLRSLDLNSLCEKSAISVDTKQPTQMKLSEASVAFNVSPQNFKPQYLKGL